MLLQGLGISADCSDPCSSPAAAAGSQVKHYTAHRAELFPSSVSDNSQDVRFVLHKKTPALSADAFLCHEES